MQSPADILVVQHMPTGDSRTFRLSRLTDGKVSEAVSLPSPWEFPVEGRPHSSLMGELQWYLESFLDYPFPPDTERAERVRHALRQWGQEGFEGLFGSRGASRLFEAAIAADYSQLHLQISSDDPRVLAWPWEALCDSEVGFLAHTCQIERRLNRVRDPQPLAPGLPRDRVNVLLVVARPFSGDVRYRSIARLLVELIKNRQLAAHVDLLRPPTFDQLRRHLKEHPGYYHVLHFEGHGAYGTDPRIASGGPSPHRMQAEGRLVFEGDTEEPDPVTAEQLSVLLREQAVPAVVLNACQSAMLDERAEDPFASVATALLRSGTRSVVAMAYSLYVSGAQQFLPAFYERLFESGSVAEAARAGRQQMLAKRERVCARGLYPLDDWLLPVLYQQEPLDFSFAREAKQAFQPRASKLPEDLRGGEGPYGFIGRDSSLLELERAMRRPPAGILIHGLGGVGKTTLARGFLKWLDDTGGLEGCFWLGFQEIRSAEYVLNQMGMALFGDAFATARQEQKLAALAEVLRERRLLIVWDNFESAAGIAGTSITANLPAQDRQVLAELLERLRGGASKVILTSRSAEEWLGPQRRVLVELGGLDGEDRWEYCEVILQDLGFKPDRSDAALSELVGLLGGHPLAMRVILPKLEKMTAGKILEAIRTNLAEWAVEGDETQRKLFATLLFVEQGLRKKCRGLLVPMGLHEKYIDINYLEAMVQRAGGGWTRQEMEELMAALGVAGLARELGQGVYEMHPLLTSYLRSRQREADGEQQERWERAFVDVMARLADALTPRKLHEQRIPFTLHGANFHYALELAERLAMNTCTKALTQSLAAYALNTRNLAEAGRLCQRLAELMEAGGDANGAASTYHQLGIIAQEERDFPTARQWYLKSLAISEKQGNEHTAASTYHQLGSVALEERDFPTARQWYLKSLAISEKQGNEHGAASTYHQLGSVALEERDFPTARQWYLKSLAISEKQGNEHGAASTYHQLGSVALEERDFPTARQWYLKSLAISEKQGNEHGAASTYHQLGRLAEEQRQYVEAGECFLKALLTFRGVMDPHSAGIAVRIFLRIYQSASATERVQLEAMWRKAGLGPIPTQD